MLFPVAKPTALLLDVWLGEEGITYLRERDLREVIKRHIHAEETDLDREEGLGAINFLQLDDIPVSEEGEPVDPESVIALPVHIDLPILPSFEPRSDDPFLEQVQRSGHKWAVLTDPEGSPLLVLDCDAFVRGVFRQGTSYNGYEACHRPIVVSDPDTSVGDVLATPRPCGPSTPRTTSSTRT